MPLFSVQLNASGNGLWTAQQRLKQLTLINQSSAAVTVLRNNMLPGFSLTNAAPQNVFVFKDAEVGDIQSLGFTGGAANAVVLVSWE